MQQNKIFRKITNKLFLLSISQTWVLTTRTSCFINKQNEDPLTETYVINNNNNLTKKRAKDVVTSLSVRIYAGKSITTVLGSVLPNEV